MPVNEKAIEEFNKKLIEDSFSSTFFNDSLKKLTEIGSATPDNPTQISIDSDAYIEGTTTDIPSMDVEKISSPLKIVKQSFEEQALKNASDKQLETADDQAMKNTFDAADMAQASIENGYPEKVQAVMQSNFMNKLDEDVKYGRLSARDAITLNDINVRTIVRQTYNNVINNKSLSVEQKLKLREQIINGRTGDASIDNLPIGIRVDALNDVEDQYEKLEKRERQMIENADWGTNRYIQDQMMALSSDEEINGPANSVNREIRKKNLMAVARTPAQLKMIREWDSDWEPSQTAQLIMDEAEREGNANREFYENLWENKYISTKTFRDKISSLNTKLQDSLKSDKAKEIDQRFKAVYGFQELGENTAYNIAKQTYMSYLAGLDHAASPEEHEEGYKKAIDVAKSFPGYTSDDAQREKIVQFRQKTGYAVHQIDSLYDNAISKLVRSRKMKRSDIDTDKGNSLIYSEIFNTIKNDTGKSNSEINIIIDEYKSMKEGN